MIGLDGTQENKSEDSLKRKKYRIKIIGLAVVQVMVKLAINRFFQGQGQTRFSKEPRSVDFYLSTSKNEKIHVWLRRRSTDSF